MLRLGRKHRPLHLYSPVWDDGDVASIDVWVPLNMEKLPCEAAGQSQKNPNPKLTYMDLYGLHI